MFWNRGGWGFASFDQLDQLEVQILASGGKETGFQGCCSGKWVGARNPVSGLRSETWELPTGKLNQTLKKHSQDETVNPVGSK
ncbi:hypothetical protein K4A83_10915 [Spirulina subsalsa FACHB-351]|uniref:Uncharacterized protein n=1 Tax=Spirulina subsalsa FACHB-351 TaxID=234711 RepID=A0ABT3L5J8_9CYAN|nr:hypothetical protein [Spirulina subsalsa]MCW6036769.1 hypothetical protein [Spirulina subsalsa FACHB-351]